MANNLTNTSENGLLDHVCGNATFTVVAPLTLHLMTANGTKSTGGTEVSGGSYAAQVVAFNAAANGDTATTADITFSDMPSAAVVGVEVHDSSATPKRLWFGLLSESRDTNAGDTFIVEAGDLTLSLS